MEDREINKMVYSADDIQKILGLGRSMTYTFLEKVLCEQKPFKVLKVGKLYRVPKKGFDEWLNGK
ncbi:MAG: helix-turn-helix domain-containing protein [Anaerotignum sp.]|nr:helix-turn-helix domain-containing protein [Anaerotignum sp.]MBQ2924406.1 helix-turn-helix domain-containing protein [Anaerotignum sp.]